MKTPIFPYVTADMVLRIKCNLHGHKVLHLYALMRNICNLQMVIKPTWAQNCMITLM